LASPSKRPLDSLRSRNTNRSIRPLKRMNPLQDFDFSVLDDPAFKEDSVREEVLAPILRTLGGYRPTGRFRIERSKNLRHPYVMLGAKRHPVNIVLDYTLLVDGKAALVLDAKAPSEAIVKSAHVEQVYSYAIHPDVRCERYGLCNGRELVVFVTQQWAPTMLYRRQIGSVLWPISAIAVVRGTPARSRLRTAVRRKSCGMRWMPACLHASRHAFEPARNEGRPPCPAETPSSEASSTAPRARAPGGQSNHLVVPCIQYIIPATMRVTA